jgi:delta-1-pyrroline-5-carboxylate synthetase
MSSLSNATTSFSASTNGGSDGRGGAGGGIMNDTEFASRSALRRVRRVLVKAGTSVVANIDGRPSLTRLGAITEQISELVSDGVQVIFVSSGAVGMGKRLLRKQSKMLLSFKDIQHQSSHSNVDHTSNASTDDRLVANSPAGPRGMYSVSRTSSFLSLLDINHHNQAQQQPQTLEQKKKHYDSACAAAGQFEMMNLYSSLFAQYDIVASQILVTQNDFLDQQKLQNLHYAIERLLSLGIVPIINENDAVSGNLGYTPDDVFSDNDSLAALCARHFHAEALLLLTDVEGVYDRPPTEPNATLLRYYRSPSSNEDETTKQKIQIGEKSIQGRGGMGSKIDAAVSAVRVGSNCGACIIAAGSDLNSIRATFGRSKVYQPRGTLFCTPGSDLERLAIMEEEEMSKSNPDTTNVSKEARDKAVAARNEARKLQTLPYAVRQTILRTIADMIIASHDEILNANARDVEMATKDGTTPPPLLKRLGLTEDKLKTLAVGLRQLADISDDPLGVIKCQRELAEGLILSQSTVPIGVLMIIFESRPDSMPQISALAIASGNGLLLKGGKEATESNAILHRIIGDAIEHGSDGKIKRDLIGLVTNRGQVADMLLLDDVIDLVIPRGSNALVSYIKANTRIPVMGHADGVCHVYIDASADAPNASKIAVDAKVDYPSACNAMETLLLHVDTIHNGVASTTLMSLRAAGVKCLGGPKAMKMGLCDIAATEFKMEYGNLTCLVEVVQDIDEAIDWIHMYGSGHTETIVCAHDSPMGEEFLRRVDAACVFKNASTRFADGYRFGLGAEVGISTGRIHARGPVGVDGLLTTKWQLRSKNVDIVSEFSGTNPSKTYTHKQLHMN